jgi:hypothetical protein
LIRLRFTDGFAHDLIPVEPDSINPIVDLSHRNPFNIRQAND